MILRNLGVTSVIDKNLPQGTAPILADEANDTCTSSWIGMRQNLGTVRLLLKIGILVK